MNNKELEVLYLRNEMMEAVRLTFDELDMDLSTQMTSASKKDWVNRLSARFKAIADRIAVEQAVPNSGKVLDDAEIERIATRLYPPVFINDGDRPEHQFDVNYSQRDAAKRVLEHARNNGYLAAPDHPHVPNMEANREAIREALEGINIYASDTLSGRSDGGPDDRDWQRQCVRVCRDRARAALSLLDKSDQAGDGGVRELLEAGDAMASVIFRHVGRQYRKGPLLSNDVEMTEAAEGWARAKAKPIDSIKGELRPAVQWFAQQMEAALQRNDHKGGWSGLGHPEALDRLEDEVKELNEAVEAFSPTTALRIATSDEIVQEAADVANFAMMIADNEGPKIGHARAKAKPIDSISDVEMGQIADRLAKQPMQIGSPPSGMYKAHLIEVGLRYMHQHFTGIKVGEGDNTDTMP